MAKTQHVEVGMQEQHQLIEEGDGSGVVVSVHTGGIEGIDQCLAASIVARPSQVEYQVVSFRVLMLLTTFCLCVFQIKPISGVSST